VPLQRLKLALAPPIWRLISRSWRLQTTDRTDGDPAGPVIFACLHRDILAAIVHCRPARPALLVSKSDDGQILTRTLADDGYRFARGSTGHDGREGYVALLRQLRAGRHVGVAVDGPRGPFGHVHPGALQLARRAGVGIVPLSVRARPCLQLKTWDRTVLPLPWARIEVAAGAELRIDRDATNEQLADLARRLAAALGVPEGAR
jgi:lysophospholipid acyltransferase (LPLAT)-like uncharacterized protein